MLRQFLLVFFMVTIDAEELIKKPPRFRPDYKYVAAIDGWLKLYRVPTNWNDARTRCQLEGADLASPSNDQMLQAMVDIIGQARGVNCGVYTGVNAWFSHGDYTSIDGTPLSEMPVELTNSQTCPQMATYPCTVLLPSGTINIVECKHLYPFICYRKNNKEIHNISECGTIDSEYKYFETTGQCYKFHRQPQIWSDAYKICLAEGGHLAVINSPEEAKILSSIFAQHPAHTMMSRFKHHLLLGFIKLNKSWGTIHGQSLEEAGYAIWAPNEPNNSPHPENPGHRDPYGNNESCGTMQRDGLLNDAWCDITFAFICEKHLPIDAIEKEMPAVIKE
ncbi:C-type mannose receptor 2-like [Hyposmocoma kahamanoa]|uniref:C-type mannose receptor 2-like n=1 Tax=Hyposmocoma kahamanoa TaxID=1477025 RepID=UPI000E6D694D|nr:C-type mannose receptor 2-like [Hyposmocoma kahamanoa]